MWDTEIKQQQELYELNDTLWNKKLDTKEINFLKWQKELLLDFKESSEVSLLWDIKETNKLSFEKSDKARWILNFFLIDSDNFVDQLVLAGKLVYKNTQNIDIYKKNLKIALNGIQDNFTKQSIHSYNQKISNYSNLLYDYAYSISK